MTFRRVLHQVLRAAGFLAPTRLAGQTMLICVGMVVLGSLLRSNLIAQFIGTDLLGTANRQQQWAVSLLAEDLARENAVRLGALLQLADHSSQAALASTAGQQAWRARCRSQQFLFPQGCVLLEQNGQVRLAEPSAPNGLSWAALAAAPATSLQQAGEFTLIATRVWLTDSDSPSPVARMLVGLRDTQSLIRSGAAPALNADGPPLSLWVTVKGRPGLLDLRAPFTPAALNERATRDQQAWVQATADVSGTQWQVHAGTSRDLLLLPIQHAREAILWMLPINFLIFLIPAVVVLYLTLEKIWRAAAQVDRMTRGEIAITPLPSDNQHELDALVGAFNRLINFIGLRTRELAVQKDIAEAAVRTRARFLAAASHDLSQPLHALTVQLASVDLQQVPPREQRILQDVQRCALNLQQMFRSLLQHARTTGHQVPVQRESVSMQQVFETLAIEFQVQAEAKGLRLRLLPGSHQVFCDRAILERILRNFMSNAIRHTHRGGVLVGCRRRGNHVLVSVYDTGVGIPAELHGLVFDEFFQIPDVTQEASSSFGLGLSIVRDLAGAMQVELRLSSVPGRGSCFSVALPLLSSRALQQERTDPAQALHRLGLPSAPRKAGNVPVANAGLAVLIWNAQDGHPGAVLACLQASGYRVVVAASGAEAREHAVMSGEQPTLLVSALWLRGGESGLDAVLGLREEFNNAVPAWLLVQHTHTHTVPVLAELGIELLPFDAAAPAGALMQALVRAQPDVAVGTNTVVLQGT